MSAEPRRVLLVQVRRLGDVTLSTALLENLRRVAVHVSPIITPRS